MSKIIDLIDSYIDRDPAAKGRIETLVTSPGLHSIGIYRLSNFFSEYPNPKKRIVFSSNPLSLK